MKKSVLHLEGYYVRELSVVLNESFADKRPFGNWTGYHYLTDKKPKFEPSEFRVVSEVGQKRDDASRWRYELTIRSVGRKDAAPYTFSVSLVGYFHVHSAVQGDNDERMLVFVNAPSVLFAMAREALAAATGRGPYPAVILPLMTFTDDAEEMALKSAKVISPKLLAAKPSKKGAKKQRVKKTTKTKK